MAELQPIARDGRMSRLDSRYPNGGGEPNTSSTLPIRLHPGYGKSPQAPSALVTAPLVRVDCSSPVQQAQFSSPHHGLVE